MKSTLNRNLYCLLIAYLAISFACPNIASAAEKKDKASKRAAMMMQKMKQDMEAEKAAMQTQFDTQKKELEDKLKSKADELVKADKKLAAAERKNKSLEADVAKVSAEKIAIETKQQQTQAALDSTQKSLDELKVQHSQALADLKFNDNQRKTQSLNLTQTTKSLNECGEKNTKLHQFGTELVQLYDKPSQYEAVMRSETFLQLKRVELENVLQGYQDKLDDARFVNKNSAY